MSKNIIRADDINLVETRLDGETVYQGSFLNVKRDQVRLPDGATTIREYIEHPGAVMIIPLFDDQRVLMERQYRYPIAQVMVEFPAGKLDPNEDPLQCAQRELQEETGYRARELIRLTRIHPVISYSTEFIDLYLARGLIEGERKLDQEEFLETFITDISQLTEWVRSGVISDVKTIIGVFWLEKILSNQYSLDTPC